jgi:hypothetical protein
MRYQASTTLAGWFMCYVLVIALIVCLLLASSE